MSCFWYFCCRCYLCPSPPIPLKKYCTWQRKHRDKKNKTHSIGTTGVGLQRKLRSPFYALLLLPPPLKVPPSNLHVEGALSTGIGGTDLFCDCVGTDRGEGAYNHCMVLSHATRAPPTWPGRERQKKRVHYLLFKERDTPGWPAVLHIMFMRSMVGNKSGPGVLLFPAEARACL